MQTLDARDFTCEIITRREGMLSAVGHDLRLRAERLRCVIEREARTLDLRVEADSIVVVCALEHDRDAPGALSESDRHKIERSAREEVLDSKKFPEVRATLRWEGDEARVRLTGTLTLHGVTRPVEAEARREGERWVAELALNQGDYGIKPFSALLGALKVRPQLSVTASINARAL